MAPNRFVDRLNAAADVLAEEGVVQCVAVDFKKLLVEFDIVAIEADRLGALVDLGAKREIIETNLVPTRDRFVELLLEGGRQITALVVGRLDVGDVVGKCLVPDVRGIEHLLRKHVIVGGVNILDHVGAHYATFVPIPEQQPAFL